MTSNTHSDLVSVIIPTYNRAKRITKAIESVLRQDHSNIELIVVDDGSTDDTESVLSAYHRIKLIKQTNQGQGAARQTGLKAANGHYIASLDSDDFWNPDFISKSLIALKESGAAFAFANWTTQTQDGTVIQEAFLGKATDAVRNRAKVLGGWNTLDHAATRDIFTRHCPAPSSSCVIDRSYIKNGWRTMFKVADDWAFLLDIVMSQPGAGCTFTMDRLWTKQIDGSNIYHRHFDPVVLAKKFLHDLDILLDLHGQKLTHDEIKRFQKLICETRVDLTYALSCTSGQRIHAIGNARTCLREQPNLFNAILLLKCMAKCLLDLRKKS